MPYAVHTTHLDHANATPQRLTVEEARTRYANRKGLTHCEKLRLASRWRQLRTLRPFDVPDDSILRDATIMSHSSITSTVSHHHEATRCRAGFTFPTPREDTQSTRRGDSNVLQPRQNSALGNAYKVARRISKGAVAHPPRLGGWFLEDFCARRADFLKSGIEIVASKDRCLQRPLGHER